MRKLLGGSYRYGVYGAASEVYAFVYVITTSGMPVAVSKIVSELTSQDNPREAEGLSDLPDFSNYCRARFIHTNGDFRKTHCCLNE